MLGLLLRTAVADGRISDEELLSVQPALEGRNWRANVAVQVGDVFAYKGALWRCIQAHTTQGGWQPDKAPALWHKVEIVAEGTVRVWEKGVAYAVGDVVAFPKEDGDAVHLYSGAHLAGRVAAAGRARAVEGTGGSEPCIGAGVLRAAQPQNPGNAPAKRSAAGALPTLAGAPPPPLCRTCAFSGCLHHEGGNIMRDFSIDLVWAKLQMAIAAVGGWLGYFVGGVDGLMTALLVLMVMDYVTGVMCAVIDRELSSSVGFRGIFKKVLILMLVGVAHIVDLHVVRSGEALRSAVICFYLSNEGVSVLENAGHLGLPIPEKLKGILAQLHDRIEEADETEDGGE